MARQAPSTRKPRPQDENTPLGLAEMEFVRVYLETRNLAASARAAGSKAKDLTGAGAAILAKPAVQAELARVVTKAQERLEITADWVLRQAVELFDRLKGEMRPIQDRHGNPVLHPESGEPLFTLSQAQAALKALDLVGRHVQIGAFADRVELTASEKVVDVLLAGRARLAASQAEAKAEVIEAPKPALLTFVRSDPIEAAYRRAEALRNTPVAPRDATQG